MYTITCIFVLQFYILFLSEFLTENFSSPIAFSPVSRQPKGIKSTNLLYGTRIQGRSTERSQ